MSPRSPPYLLLPVILVLVIALAGCISLPTVPAVPSLPQTAAQQTPHATLIETSIPSAAAHSEESIAGQLAAVQSDSPVWREAYRMFRNMRSTEYVHPPYTDNDAEGLYKFDCLGFVDHVLMNATPAAYQEIGRGQNPSIESYAAAFSRFETKSPGSSQGVLVEHPVELQPGDICLWLKPNTLDTGHIWIIAGDPWQNPKRTDEILVRIFDSTATPHSNDSRAGSAYPTGLGSGILGFMVDQDGKPAGLYWEGGRSTAAGEKDTTIICGRLAR